jgi:hypothetical protein
MRAGHASSIHGSYPDARGRVGPQERLGAPHLAPLFLAEGAYTGLPRSWYTTSAAEGFLERVYGGTRVRETVVVGGLGLGDTVGEAVVRYRVRVRTRYDGARRLRERPASHAPRLFSTGGGEEGRRHAGVGDPRRGLCGGEEGDQAQGG